MRPSSRFTFVFLALLTALALAGTSYAQDDAVARAAVANGQAGFVNPVSPVDVTTIQAGTWTIGSGTVLDAETGAIIGAPSSGLNSALVPIGGGNDDHLVNGDVRHTPTGGTLPGLDTVATFDGAFFAQAGPSSTGLRIFRFTMMGQDPQGGDTTVIPTRIDEVSLQLLNADGSLFKTVSYAPFEQASLESPNYEPLDYRSGHNIEYADAVHRAQFFHVMEKDWHTVLIPHIVNRVTITVPFFVNVRLSNGNIIQARTYFTGTAADGSTFVLMLNLLFNNFFFNISVNDINAGNFTTNGLNQLWFPNTFLFSLNVNNPNVPGGCCVLGFHTFFFEPGLVPQPRWVTLYQSWISPGIFGGGFQDVTAMTHEIAESFGDPFLDNATPNWQFPGVPPTAKICQNNLEEGDPIEVLAHATFPTTVHEGSFNFTFHPQNIPLLQWFEMGKTSDAVDGAFSFPDETLLPHSALPCPL